MTPPPMAMVARVEVATEVRIDGRMQPREEAVEDALLEALRVFAVALQEAVFSIHCIPYPRCSVASVASVPFLVLLQVHVLQLLNFTELTCAVLYDRDLILPACILVPRVELIKISQQREINRILWRRALFVFPAGRHFHA